jgi:hypothetical protein
VHDDHFVEAFQQVQAVDRGHHARILQRGEEIVVDTSFRARIETRRRLVEQDQPAVRSGENAPGERYAGTLTARPIRTALDH